MAATLSACHGAPTTSIATPLPSAPEPAVSPAVSTPPAGSVVPLAGGPEGIVVDGSGDVAVNVRQPDGLVVFNLANPAERQTFPLPGSARHLALAALDGPVLVPGESDDRVAEVALPSGRVEQSIPVGRQPHDAIAVGPGAVWATDEFGNSIHILRDGVSVRVVPAPLQPGGLAASADGSVVVAVGVRGRRISAYRSDGSLIGTANCGTGPTHAVTGAAGLYWVVDTNGGAVLAFTVDSHGPRQVARVAVGAQPYGVAYDARRDTLWVTLTGSNQLVGLHLMGTTVRSRTTYPTVQQPNTVAVADSTGELVVTGSMANGALQFIAASGPAPG